MRDDECACVFLPPLPTVAYSGTTVFIATFSSEDPGTLSVAQRYFSMPADILGSSWGGLGVEQVDGLEALIPDNPTLGADACLRVRFEHLQYSSIELT